jgi:hypothetical protein
LSIKLIKRRERKKKRKEKEEKGKEEKGKMPDHTDVLLVNTIQKIHDRSIAIEDAEDPEWQLYHQTRKEEKMIFSIGNEVCIYSKSRKGIAFCFGGAWYLITDTTNQEKVFFLY